MVRKALAMDCSPEAIANAKAIQGDPVPGQYVELACAPPHEFTWYEAAFVGAQLLCAVGLFALVIVLRNKFYATHGRDWRDEL